MHWECIETQYIKNIPAAELRQIHTAQPLVITVAPRAEKGTITVYDYNGNCIYGYYGEITIENDGRNGEDIAITCKGYLEGYIDHTDD